MLTPTLQSRELNGRSRQKGVVLLITLIMLVAMTLAAIALMRSVDTTNLVSGNLAFQQSSLNAADTGTETAIAYLYNNVPNLQCDGSTPTNPCANGYKSYHQPLLEPPTANTTWESYWTAMVGGPGVVSLTTLPTGYSGAFVIEAMCGSPQQVNCTIATSTTTTTTPQGQDIGSTSRDFSSSTQTSNLHYYRITTRVVGPRNSVSYVQAMIAL
ncbi:pilus assembly PilX family protein [Sideroxydans lithotrophicus]|uniref:Type IV pilus assembly protein PilX n=1 Tax=Sideroxydans lithotrophicus (strain ES-1) TaxID=580332 RepID=D5CU02_SIDLE|nr:type IV pilus assembly protein PilX [Sideroxydans lithotrophicus]ADE12314.1 type IV pilus assembly protein PilX [Sideroxydans lithotrophicus ES-1]